MASKIGTAVVFLTAKTTKFMKAMKTAQRTAGRVFGGIAKAGKMMGLAVAAGAAAAGGSLIAIANKTANLGDQFQKMALRTGFSVKSLSELKHAAELSGTSIDALEKGIKTSAKFIDDLGDEVKRTGKHTGTYGQAITKLGLTYDDLKNKQPEEQFRIMTEALANVGDATTRSAMASEMFGRAGTQMLPMLAAGSAGLRDMRAEAHTLGIAFDQVAADDSAKFNDSMDKLKKAIGGVGLSIGKELLPKFIEFSENAKEFVLNTKDSVLAFFDRLTDAAKGSGFAFGDAEGAVKRFFDFFTQDRLNGIISGLSRMAGALSKVVGWIIKASEKGGAFFGWVAGERANKHASRSRPQLNMGNRSVRLAVGRMGGEQEFRSGDLGRLGAAGNSTTNNNTTHKNSNFNGNVSIQTNRPAHEILKDINRFTALRSAF